METSLQIQNLEKLLASGKDGALLRFSVGSEYLKIRQFPQAIAHLACAVEHNRDYSAAWKLLGKAHLGASQVSAAREAWTTGIDVAERRGDKRGAKAWRYFFGASTRNRTELEPDRGTPSFGAGGFCPALLSPRFDLVQMLRQSCIG